MGRPEQHGKGKRSPAHEGRHGGEIVEGTGRREGGAMAPGNTNGRANRISAAMRMRNAMREAVGVEGIEELTNELMKIARNSPDPKDQISAIKAILDYTVGKSQQEVMVASETGADGAQRMVFYVRGEDGDKEL